jgi:hypothetical protein
MPKVQFRTHRTHKFKAGRTAIVSAAGDSLTLFAN